LEEKKEEEKREVETFTTPEEPERVWIKEEWKFKKGKGTKFKCDKCGVEVETDRDIEDHHHYCHNCEPCCGYFHKVAPPPPPPAPPPAPPPPPVEPKASVCDTVWVEKIAGYEWVECHVEATDPSVRLVVTDVRYPDILDAEVLYSPSQFNELIDEGKITLERPPEVPVEPVPPPPPPPPEKVRHGIFVHEIPDAERPIPDVIVSVNGLEGLTDDRGLVYFDLVPDTIYTVTLRKEGYKEFSQDFTSSTEPITLSIGLETEVPPPEVPVWLKPVTDAITAILDPFSKVLTTISDTITGIPTALAEAFTDVFKGIGEWFKDRFVTKALPEIDEELVGATLKEEMFRTEEFRNIVRDLKVKLRTSPETVTDWFKDVMADTIGKMYDLIIALTIPEPPITEDKALEAARALTAYYLDFCVMIGILQVVARAFSLTLVDKLVDIGRLIAGTFGFAGFFRATVYPAFAASVGPMLKYHYQKKFLTWRPGVADLIRF